jgi:hypothetical protein
MNNYYEQLINFDFVYILFEIRNDYFIILILIFPYRIIILFVDIYLIFNSLHVI